MIFEIALVTSVVVLTPVGVFLGKKLYVIALRKGWKKPDQYAYFFGSFMIMPAMAMMNLLAKITGSDIFTTGGDSETIGGWLLYACIAILLIACFRIPHDTMINKYLSEKDITSENNLL